MNQMRKITTGGRSQFHVGDAQVKRPLTQDVGEGMIINLAGQSTNLGRLRMAYYRARRLLVNPCNPTSVGIDREVELNEPTIDRTLIANAANRAGKKRQPHCENSHSY